MVYVIPERSYYFTFSTNLNIDIALEHLNSKFPDIVNMKITKISRQVEHLLTIRKEQSKLVFLFNEGVASLGKTEEKCGFYVACIIDFENNGIEIKLNQHLRRSTGKKVKNIISEVEEFLKRNLSFSTPTESFYFQPNRSNEAFIHKGLYKLFEEESSRSLDLIKRKIAEFEGEEDVEQAEKVLKLNVSKYLEEELHLRSPEPYVNKVLSAKYQDTALIMEEAEFINDGGYIFGFTFVDRKITKSSNKNEENKPVYYSKIFGT